MTCLPVIERELREGARRGFTYWLRVLSAVAAVTVFGGTMVYLSVRGASSTLMGRVLFFNLQVTLFVAIWVLVPFLTADTLSRERREGTLGLLFLTPLTPMGVVLGKGMAEVLRGLTIALALVPVMTVPFLLGGVTVEEVSLVAGADAVSLLLALSAGLLASAWSREWNRAVLGAVGLAAVLVTLFCGLYGLAYLRWVFNSGPLVPRGMGLPPELAVSVGFQALSGFSGHAVSRAWTLLSAPAVRPGAVVYVNVGALLLALGWVWTVLWLAARRLQQVARLDAATPPAPAWQQALLEPRFWRQTFRRRLTRSLSRNPVGWLQQYRTMSRVTKWGWGLGLVIAETWLLANVGWYAFPAMQVWLGALLLGSLLLASAASFRRERESGAMELLLVTPLRVGQIILGRLRGLWAQFLPALVILVLSSLSWVQFDATRRRGLLRFSEDATLCVWLPLALTVVYVAAPCVALYYSLTRRTLVAAFLLSVLAAAVVPLVAGTAFWAVLLGGAAAVDRRGGFGEWVLMVLAAQVPMAVRSLVHLHRRLRRREFAWGGGVS